MTVFIFHQLMDRTYCYFFSDHCLLAAIRFYRMSFQVSGRQYGHLVGAGVIDEVLPFRKSG
jgi:hypothetical protein